MTIGHQASKEPSALQAQNHTPTSKEFFDFQLFNNFNGDSYQ